MVCRWCCTPTTPHSVFSWAKPNPVAPPSSSHTHTVPSLHFVPALVVNLIPARRAIISGVELAVIRIFRIRIVGRRSLWLVQRIGSLVLFPHAVHDEHDHEYGAEQANDGTANDSWKRKWCFSKLCTKIYHIHAAYEGYLSYMSYEWYL